MKLRVRFTSGEMTTDPIRRTDQFVRIGDHTDAYPYLVDTWVNVNVGGDNAAEVSTGASINA